ncbi:MAG: hypothetical protein K2J15_06880 [Muribaculaceae bacterium]|nr:hypothetical protein [Muribaculaceae bacterium]
MSLWHYISEFLLFRWLFGKSRRSNSKPETPLTGNPNSASLGRNTFNDPKHPEYLLNSGSGSPVPGYSRECLDNPEALDDPDPDGLDDLDDLDLFMLHNSRNKHDDINYGYTHHSEGNYTFDDSYGLRDSYLEDFHEEQDDYDMLDDF